MWVSDASDAVCMACVGAYDWPGTWPEVELMSAGRVSDQFFRLSV